jgi:hypothetical protein
MRDKIKKSTLIYLFFVAVSCLVPAMSWAVLAVQTEVASGNIIQKYEDHSVKLDNGIVYHPSRQGLVINVQVGEPVTLRYVVEDPGKNVFIEFAPGLNSLKASPPAPESSKRGARPTGPK